MVEWHKFGLMNIFVEYIKYRWNARTLHGIHSPFIFDFMEKASKLRPNVRDEMVIKNFVFKQRRNRKKLEIKDYGAKSKKLDQYRSIDQIFKTSSSFGKNGILLFRICMHFKPQNILELGTSIGMGSLYMHLGNPKSRLISIEGCPETHSIAKENLKTYPIELINNTFKNAIQTFSEEKFDLVFIDGHHNGKALLEYMDALMEYTHDNTIFVLDDIRWSHSMLDSWNKLSGAQTYHLSLDFFRMGVLVRRPQQVKENFILRFKK
tara:strand:+ start:834 stop:1625 length:792 start_codon:yes stop_codon:yes gene_type:complete